MAGTFCVQMEFVQELQRPISASARVHGSEFAAIPTLFFGLHFLINRFVDKTIETFALTFRKIGDSLAFALGDDKTDTVISFLVIARGGLFLRFGIGQVHHLTQFILALV